MSTASSSALEMRQVDQEAPAIHERWYFLFFVISGFCGLVYEVVWLRLAMASFGVTSAMTSIVISMFMAGLGLGSWATGALARSKAMNARVAMRMYAAAEFLIGLSSITVPWQLHLGRSVLEHTSAVGAWQSTGYYVIAGLWMALTLVPWCACMGATFPFLMAAIRRERNRISERSFSYLYVANVLGALAGSFASAFVLIEMLGFHRTLYVAGVCNLALAGLAFALSARANTEQVHEESELAARSRSRADRLILPALFTTGFVSMGLEVIWIRQYTPYLGNVVYSFAGILAVYLMSTILGSYHYREIAAKGTVARSVWDWTLLAFGAVLPVLAADPMWNHQPGLIHLVRVLGIVPFCAIAGFITPSLVDAWSGGEPKSAGSAYAVNVAGSIVGPLVAGFVLLPAMSERWATVAMALPLFIIALVKINTGASAKVKFAVAVAASLLIGAFSHDYESRYTKPVVRRDYAATVVAITGPSGKELLVNGITMTALTPITKYMAHLPLALLPHKPKNGLVICFGMGTSFRSMLSWGIPTTAVDLIPSVPKLFGYFQPDAAQLERSPLAHIVVDDGRRYLDTSSEKFDVIVVDPPPPVEATGSSLLYTVEFYDVVKKHLSDDGILQTWYPSRVGDIADRVAVAKAIYQSFPYVRAYPSIGRFGIHFIASMKPLPELTSAELAAKLPPAAAKDFVEWGPKTDAQSQFSLIMNSPWTEKMLTSGAPNVPAMHDDRPINEYFLLRTALKSYN